LTLAAAQIDSYLECFTEFAQERANDPRWLRDLRDAGFARFSSVGFPTTRDEDWRFTSVAPIARTPFTLPNGTSHHAGALAELSPAAAAARLVFVDGKYAPELSSTASLPEGATATSLRSAIEQRSDDLSRHLGRYLDIQRDSFSALNTAFLDDGAYIHVPRGAVIADPIYLLYVATPGAGPKMTHPRNLIVVEDEGQAVIVEHYLSEGEPVPALCNAVTELVAGENATVAHMLMECEHLESYNISTLRIEQARSANVSSHSMLLGGALVRNNVHPVLAGEGGECLINGLFIGGGRQHLDNYMLVEHRSPHCGSRQFYNGILDEHAHGVFHGRIIVHKDAQRTNAKQTNRNLLLSDDAQIDTKPQLEIHADDVKCTHGATIGQMEDDALFYLRSRGLPEPEARRMLLEAFAGEFLEKVRPETVRAYARRAMEERLLALPIAQAASGRKQDGAAEGMEKEGQ
jgi:Fe-S cluster assembly protein SufD